VTGLPPGGPYVYTITITDANGCTASGTASVVIAPLPVANAGNDTTVCRYSIVQLNGTASGGTPPYTYAWTPGTGLSDSTIANPTTTVSANITYCLVVTDSLGCVSAPDCVDLNVFPPPTINSPPSVLCATDPNPLTSTFTVTGAGAGSTYQWYLSADYTYISSANADSSSVTATYPSGIPATYNFIVIVTDGVTGCVDTLSTAFTINPGLTMGINGPFTICAGQSVTLTATGATTYAWTASPSFVFPDSTLASQNVSPATTTTYTVLGTTGTCSQQLSTTVNVNPPPIAVAAPIPPFCGCTNVSLNGTGSTPGMVYLWTSAGGNPIVSPTSLVTSSFICTSDVFTLVVTDTTTGCSDSVSVSANEIANPAAVASVTPNMICNGVATMVTLDGTGSDTNPGTTYQWSSSPPVPIADTTAYPTTTAIVTTTTTFTLTVTAASGCDSTVTTTVNIFPPPVLTGNPGALCTTDPQIVTLSITGAGAGSTYNWIIIPPCAVPNTTSAQSQVFDLSGCGAGNFTFSVVVTDGVTGCVDTISTTIPIVTGVILVTSGNQTICEGDALTLTAAGALTYQWYLSPDYTYITSANVDSSSVTVSPTLPASGSPFQFIVIGTTGSCSDTDTVAVIVNPVPVTSSINPTANVCENVLGQMYYVTGSAGSTFFWTVTGGTLASGQGNDTIFVDWGSAGGGTITVVETNTFGCAGAPVVLNITINPLPNTSSITGPTIVCSGSSANYSVTNVAGSTYSWTVTGGIPPNGSGSIINVTWGAPGSGTVSVIETNAVGCSDTIVILNVVINPIPVTPPISGPTPVCEGTTGSVYTVAPTAGSTYNWSIAGNGNITFGQGTNSITVDWLAPPPATATITVVEVNSFGCPGAPQTYVVTINATPTAVIDSVSQDTICEGASVLLYGTAANGTILWTTSGNGTFNNSNIDSPTYTSGSADVPLVTLTMTVSNPPCPDAIATVQITVIPLPVTSAISGPDTVCANSTGNIYSVINNVGSVYSWTVAGGTIVSGNGSNQITVDWGAAGSGTVSVTEYNFFGCMGSTSTWNVFILLPPVTPPIIGTDTVCAGDTGSMYYVTNTPGSSYSWTVTGGTFTQNGDTITVAWDSSGTGTITVTETSAYNCIGNQVTFTVIIRAYPTAIASAAVDTLCSGQPFQLNGIATGGNPLWQTSGSGVFNPAANDTTIYTPAVSDTGTIIISLIVSNGVCPNDTAFVALTIIPVPNVILSTSDPDSTICLGDSITITATGGGTYLWTPGGDTTSSITVNPMADTTYSVVVTNSFGCSASASIGVSVTPPGTASAGADMIVCNTDSVFLNGIVFNAGGGGWWRSNGGGTFLPDTSSMSAVYVPDSADIANGTITLILTTTGACLNLSDTIIIILDSPVTVNAGPDQTVNRNATATISGTVNGTTGGWWTTSGSGIFVPDSSALTAVYQPSADDYNSGFIYIILLASNICNTAVDTLILYFPDFIIPNVFTPYPNTPGFNDFFEIRGLPAHSSLEIFNRWGLLIFKADSYQNNWDAAEVNDDTYFYILNTPDKKSYHGTVRVIKKEE
jgi:gliding motility-associated-like protein